MSFGDRLLSGSIEEAQRGRLESTREGGEFTDVVVDAPIDSDWSRIFLIFSKDPDEYEIVDDTVRESTWQQSARGKDGTRDLVQLWSYSARFKRKPKARLSDAEVEALADRVRSWELSGPKPDRSGTPCAAVVTLADIQAGKSEGGGVQATSQRLLDGLANVQRYLDRVREDRNVTELVIVNNGDPLEGCAGNYASQLFTVELNLRGQMNFVLDHWLQYAKQLYPQFAKGQFVSVLCNHGEAGRFGSNKNQTSDSDNMGGFLAETLQRVLSANPRFGHVEWTIPHDEMTVYPLIANVPCGYNHGHKVQGADATGFEKWLNGQVRGDAGAHAARIWGTAHRHNLQVFDLGSATVFQAPSLDGGSKWLRDMTGRFSRSGIIAYLVGEHDRMGWSDLAFL